MGYTSKISFLSAFICPLFLFPRYSQSGWGLVCCSWGDDEGRKEEEWLCCYLGGEMDVPWQSQPTLATLMFSPGGERLTLPLFWLGVSESLLISQWEIHIHTCLSPRLSLFGEKHYTVGSFVKVGRERRENYFVCVTGASTLHTCIPYYYNNRRD